MTDVIPEGLPVDSNHPDGEEITLATDQELEELDLLLKDVDVDVPVLADDEEDSDGSV